MEKKVLDKLKPYVQAETSALIYALSPLLVVNGKLSEAAVNLVCLALVSVPDVLTLLELPFYLKLVLACGSALGDFK